MQLKRSDAFLTTQVGDELVMLNIDSGDFMGLTASAAAVWDLLAKPSSIEALCESLLAQFDIAPAQCREEVSAFVDEMIAKGAILTEAAA